ncbi:hypothetical protein [Streptomyces acidiscabies]|uniref:SseB protein N-terminal domain-containing protein n=1 Tax=Streptomyces acidiscabies TaxID=42234 RepID=A0ABU4M6Z7_9ACTN|nr:hypothetical protein [Streptomyces acidiscabies]MBZ3916814.1 hypothetical protein [Streptomyces acidiscabies]MDX3022964.1 hypothetical protein [Streptomyces acidiscabies]MDX3794238.1 hypothetical protein [Streptomyces acidiscabies]
MTTRLAVDPHPLNSAAPLYRQDQVVLRVNESGQVPQVCLYVSAVGTQHPERLLKAALLFVEKQDWRVGQVFADDYGWSTCAAQPGWGAVRREIYSGRANGVVVPTLSVISSHPDEVAEQLGWFAQSLAFIAVTEASEVVPPGGYVAERNPLSPGSMSRSQYGATQFSMGTMAPLKERSDTRRVLMTVEWMRYPLAGVLAVMELVSRAVERGGQGPVTPVISVDADGSLVVSVSVSRLGTPPSKTATVAEATAVWLRELGGEVVCRPQSDGSGDVDSVRLPVLSTDRVALAVTSASVSAEEV